MMIKHRLKKTLLYLFILVPTIFAWAQADLIISTEQIANIEDNSSGNIKKRFRAWKNLINKYKNHSIKKKLVKTNDFFNMFHYQSDISYKGSDDYWKAPDEFLKDGGGDCEDFSIAKYFTLMAMGVPMERLKITYVKSTKLKQPHMVLTYYGTPEAEPLVLDNLKSKILPASERPDLIPVYSFNAEGLWLAKQRSQDKYLGKSSRLKRWEKIIKHIKTMGKQP